MEKSSISLPDSGEGVSVRAKNKTECTFAESLFETAKRSSHPSLGQSFLLNVACSLKENIYENILTCVKSVLYNEPAKVERERESNMCGRPRATDAVYAHLSQQ